MRPIDLNTTGAAWLYTPGHHKSEYRQRSRIVVVGPKAQELLRPFLQRDVAAYMFSPREAVQQRNAECPTHRRGPAAEAETGRRVGERYTTQAYGRAITAMCTRLDVPHWSPGQLRHNAATRLRSQFGLDVAQVVLGHARADITEVYAAQNLARAIEAMERVG